MQLYFIRHGQSTNNAIMDNVGDEYLVHRVTDPDLTAIGEKQAKLAAKLLAKPAKHDGFDPQNRNGFGITHLYCSLMTRAVKTGLAISKETGVPLKAWPEAHETGGVFESDMQDGEPIFTGRPGKGKSYFEKEFPELIIPDDLPETGWWNKEKEPRENYQKRAQAIIDRLVEEHGGNKDRVGIITHGGIFTRILTALFDIQAEHYWFLMNNCAVSRIDIHEEGRFTLMYMNKVDYLPDDLIT
ncbi:MAG: histidine phosphatase family protein [Chloroflexota bacterium]|jgi:2,3-bisphosphoglycerate-dependent phosphoglycerate mutase|nr:histidine phosphatase family protein [Chloroflexota bacterium]